MHLSFAFLLLLGQQGIPSEAIRLKSHKGFSAERIESANPVLDSLTDLIRYSWVPDGTSEPLFVRAKRALFKASDEIRPQPNEQITALRIRSYTQKREFSHELTSSMTAEGSYGAFSASAEVATESMVSGNVQKFRLDRKIVAKKFTVKRSSVYQHRMLTDDAKQYLLEEHVENIARDIGPFYADYMVLGGLLQVTQMTEMTSGEATSKLQGSIMGEYSLAASVKVSASGSVTDKKIDETTRVFSKWLLVGGDPNIWLNLKNDDSNLEDTKSKWAETVDDDSLGVIEIKLVPIWTLLDHDDMDRTKARQLEAHFKKKWQAEYEKISDLGPKVKCEDTRRNYCTAHPINAYQPSCSAAHGDGYEGIGWEHCGILDVFGGRYICRKKFICPPGSVCNGGGCKAR